MKEQTARLIAAVELTGLLHRSGELDTLAGHTYFGSSRGAAVRAQLAASGCTRITQRAYEFERIQVSYNWSELQVFSGDDDIDNELSVGGSGAESLGLSPVTQNTTEAVALEDAVLVVQRNCENYYHFAAEVLPSLWSMRDVVDRDLAIAMPETAFGAEAVRLLGFRNRHVRLPSEATVLGRKVRMFRLMPAGIIDLPTVRSMRQTLWRNANCDSYRGASVIYLVRAPSRLTNEDEVIAAVRRHFPSVDIFNPGDLSFADQVRRCCGARIIISSHGAQCANLLWSERLEHFVEITATAEPHRDFELLARVAGARVWTVACETIRSEDNWSPARADCGNLTDVLKSVKEVIG